MTDDDCAQERRRRRQWYSDDQVIDLGGIIFGFYCRTRAKCITAAGGVSDLRTSEATTLARVYR